MRQRSIVAGCFVCLVAALVSGCGSSKSPTAPLGSGNDPSEVNTTLALSTSLVDDGLATDSTQASASSEYDGPPTGLAAIHPFTWWQHVVTESRHWSLAFSDSDTTGHFRTCIATLTDHMTGWFVIVPSSPTDSTVAGSTRILKPLDKTLTREVRLDRILIGTTRLWKVTQITGAFVTTPSATAHIIRIRVQSKSGVDTTFTDPLQFESLRHILKFGTSDSVTVTVTTSHTDDAVYIHRLLYRHRLHNNGDGTYTFAWVTSSWSGWRHFGIQAITHATLYDDTAAPDFQAWHFPFRVVGGQPDVDYYP